jgi:hypothetical protein
LPPQAVKISGAALVNKKSRRVWLAAVGYYGLLALVMNAARTQL